MRNIEKMLGEALGDPHEVKALFSVLCRGHANVTLQDSRSSDQIQVSSYMKSLGHTDPSSSPVTVNIYGLPDLVPKTVLASNTFQ